MPDSQIFETGLSIDLKKYRIRLYKSALHQIGDPKYIQLLVNPFRMAVAVRAVESDGAEAQAHKVSSRLMSSSNSVEIYSRAFVEKLCAVIGGLDPKYTYLLSGTVLPEKKLAVFSLKTIRKHIEGETGL